MQYRYRLLAKWISALSVSAKNLGIGQNIGKYRYLGIISAKYRLRKHIGIGKYIGLANTSVSAKILAQRKYQYRYRINPYWSNLTRGSCFPGRKHGGKNY
jgi:hypothetical protein